jgi:hypothetical protein
VQRRVHEVEQREGGGGALVAEPGPGQAEHREAAQGQRGQVAHELDVVAQIERVRREGQVAVTVTNENTAA